MTLNAELKKSDKIRLTQVMQQQKLDPLELKQRMDWLQLEPQLHNKQAYLSRLQLELLHKLNLHLQDGKSPESFLSSLTEVYLYRCKNCGDLKLCAYPLHHEGLLHNCTHNRWRLLEKTFGELELVASGPYNLLLGWAHSLLQKQDNPFKGI